SSSDCDGARCATGAGAALWMTLWRTSTRVSYPDAHDPGPPGPGIVWRSWWGWASAALAEHLQQLLQLVLDGVGDQVAGLVADRVPVVTHVLHREVGVVVAGREADEEPADHPAGRRVD